MYASPTGETAYFQLNPNGNISGPLITIRNNFATDRFFLSSCNWKASLTNFNSIASTVWIYCLKATQNHNFEPTSALAQAITQEGLGIATNTQPGPGTNSGGGFGIPTVATPGLTLRNVKNFSKFWKVQKVHRVDLAAGASEDVDFHVKMNQMGSIARFMDINPLFTTSSASWTAANLAVNYPSGCCAFVIATRGQVVRDQTLAGVKFPTFGDSSIGVIIDKIHHFYPVKDQANRVDFSTVYNQLPYGVNTAKQSTINEVDAIQSVQTA